MLKKKAMEMNQMLDLEGGGQSAQNQALQQQKKEYGARGIALAELEKSTKRPHFVNIDLDPFRSHRFIFFCPARWGYDVRKGRRRAALRAARSQASRCQRC